MSHTSSVGAAAERAEISFRAITHRRIYSSRRHLFGSRRWFRRRSYEDLWPYADAWSAICTFASLGTADATAAALSPFVDGLAAYHRLHAAALDSNRPVGFECVVVPPLGGGGDVFFDDNSWLGLSLMHHGAAVDDPRALAIARRVFAFVTSGWSSDASWSHPGGIRWKMRATSPSRNTCSNAPAAQLGALIHERTGDEVALEWSLRIYAWVRATLLGGDGLYFDRIEADGTVSYEVWSYNQGTMIGAGVLLHRITGEQGYLDQAIATATAASKRFTVEGPLGESRPAFSAVLVRNLFLLDQVAPDPSYRQLAEAYGEQMWMRLRDPRTGLFGGDLSALNNSAPMLEIYALLGGATPHP